LSSVTVLGFYYLATYTPTFLIVTVQMPRPAALWAVAIGALIYAACCPLAGFAAESLGRRKVSLLGSGGLALFSIPAFWLMGQGTVGFAVAGIVLFGIFEALHNVTTTVMLIELFPASSRVTSASIGYNLGAALVAGPGPLIAAALAAASGGGALPAAYMAVTAIIVTIAMAIWLPETRGVDIGAAPAPLTQKSAA
jgi:MHS family proline/betaine transporter-like MFS transporter